MFVLILETDTGVASVFAAQLIIAKEARTASTAPSVDPAKQEKKKMKLETLELPITSFSVVGYVAQQGKSVNIADAYADPRFNTDIDKQTGFHTEHVLAVPVRQGGRKGSEVISVIQALNKLDEQVSGEIELNPKGFSHDDLVCLEFVARLAGQALSNTLLYEKELERQRQNTALIRMIQASAAGGAAVTTTSTPSSKR